MPASVLRFAPDAQRPCDLSHCFGFAVYRIEGGDAVGWACKFHLEPVLDSVLDGLEPRPAPLGTVTVAGSVAAVLSSAERAGRFPILLPREGF